MALRRRGWRRCGVLLIPYIVTIYFVNHIRILIISDSNGGLLADMDDNNIGAMPIFEVDDRNKIDGHHNLMNATKTMSNLKSKTVTHSSISTNSLGCNNSSNATHPNCLSAVTPSPCDSLHKPSFGKESQTFQKSYGSGHVFSAHYDYREKIVQVVALGNLMKRKWFCQMWFRSNDSVEVVDAPLRVLPENHNRPIFGFQISCRFKGAEIPYAVSIVSSRCEKPNNILYVTSHEPSTVKKGNLTICTTPMFYKYDNVAQLVELIEVNRMFGVDRFVFYNLSISKNMDMYLRHYMSTGSVDVIQWHLPRGNPANSYGGVYYFAQVAAYTDCLLRSLGKSTYISFTDLDEIIVPRAPGNINNLLDKYKYGLAGKCSILIRNSFFRTDWPSDPESESNPTVRGYQINTLLKTRRENKIWNSGMRSKYIAKVSRLGLPGIHFPMHCGKSGRWVVADTKDALLHHYRAWDNTTVHNDAVKDTFMYKHKDEIVSRIHKVHETLGWRA